jgi:hypothetical protein
MRILSLTLIAASTVALSSAAIARPASASRLSVQSQTGGQGNAQSTPRRNPTTPRGLAAAFARGVPGIFRAFVATAGSNSRLQDLPASP